MIACVSCINTRHKRQHEKGKHEKHVYQLALEPKTMNEVSSRVSQGIRSNG